MLNTLFDIKRYLIFNGMNMKRNVLLGDYLGIRLVYLLPLELYFDFLPD